MPSERSEIPVWACPLHAEIPPDCLNCVTFSFTVEEEIYNLSQLNQEWQKNITGLWQAERCQFTDMRQDHIYWLIYNSTLTYDCKIWVVTKRRVSSHKESEETAGDRVLWTFQVYVYQQIKWSLPDKTWKILDSHYPPVNQSKVNKIRNCKGHQRCVLV